MNDPKPIEEFEAAVDLPVVEPIVDENGDVIEYRSIFDD